MSPPDNLLSICHRTLVSLVLSLALCAPALAGNERRTPIEVFSSDLFDDIATPALSRFAVPDPTADCDPGEVESDALTLFGARTFSPFETTLMGAKVTSCEAPGDPSSRRLLISAPWQVLKTGDIIDGENFQIAKEYRQLGNAALVLAFTGPKDIVVEGVWDGANVNRSVILATGFDLGDGTTLDRISAFGGVHDGTRLQLALTYTNDLDEERIGFFEKGAADASLSLRAQFRASADLGLGGLLQPRSGLDCPGKSAPGGAGCPNPAPVFHSYYGQNFPSGGNTELRHTWLPVGPITTLNSTLVIGLGDVTPLNNETLSSFGLGFSHAAGNQIGGFIGTTSSGANAYFQYDVNSVMPPGIVSGAKLPDTGTTATQFDTVSYDYNRVALLGRGGLTLEGIYIAEVFANLAPVLMGGYRSRVDPINGRDTTDIFMGNQSIQDGVAAFSFEIDFGSELGIGIMDVGRAEILRGPQGTLFAANTAGALQIDSSTEMGFQFQAGQATADFAAATRAQDASYFFATNFGDVFDFAEAGLMFALRGSTGLSGVTGLGIDDQDNMYVSTASQLQLVARPGFTPSLVGNYADLSGPVTNISGIEWDDMNDFMGAIGEDGRYFSVDLGTAMLTHRASFEVLPNATPQSIAVGFDSRYVSGFSDGRVATYFDASTSAPFAAGSASGDELPQTPLPQGPTPPPLLPASVLGDTAGGSVTGIVVPEPSAALLQCVAMLTLGTLGVGARMRSASTTRSS